MDEKDLGDTLRGLYKDRKDMAVFELEPLLRAAERKGLIHKVTCEEALRSSLLDLRNGENRQNFTETWNSVSHIMECEKRACAMLRTPIHLTKYEYPNSEEYKEIESQVREAYLFDRKREEVPDLQAEAMFELLISE